MGESGQLKTGRTDRQNRQTDGIKDRQTKTDKDGEIGRKERKAEREERQKGEKGRKEERQSGKKGRKSSVCSFGFLVSPLRGRNDLSRRVEKGFDWIQEKKKTSWRRETERRRILGKIPKKL